MYDSDSILQAGNEVLRHLDELLGADAQVVREKIQVLLQRAAAGEDVADLLLGILSSREPLRKWTLNFLQKTVLDGTKLYTPPVPPQERAERRRFEDLGETTRGVDVSVEVPSPGESSRKAAPAPGKVKDEQETLLRTQTISPPGRK